MLYVKSIWNQQVAAHAGEKQIPCGDDNKKSNGKNKDKSRSPAPPPDDNERSNGENKDQSRFPAPPSEQRTLAGDPDAGMTTRKATARTKTKADPVRG